jgi:hypothetical protein
MNATELIDYLNKKHPDHLIVMQELQMSSHKGKSAPYFWEFDSYKYLNGVGIPTPPLHPIAESVLVATVKEFCEKTQKSIIIIDNNIMLSPYYQIIHPIKTPSNDTPPNA